MGLKHIFNGLTEALLGDSSRDRLVNVKSSAIDCQRQLLVLGRRCTDGGTVYVMLA